MRHQEQGQLCHVCDGARPAMDECAACFGRGLLLGIDFCADKWNEVAPGLWVGGHDYASDDPDFWYQHAVVGAEFDVVFSLYRRAGHGPADGVEHHHHRMPDSALGGADGDAVLALAQLVAERLGQGKKVLVRCQAGLNRSSLVAALALVQRGWQPDEAIDAIRQARSMNCLFNRSFIAFIRAQQPR